MFRPHSPLPTCTCPAHSAKLMRTCQAITIYGNHIYFVMSTIKTTVYLDAADYRRLKALAAADSRSAAELIRAAVSEYARRRAPERLPRSLGAACSGYGQLSERAEDLLQGMGEDS